MACRMIARCGVPYRGCTLAEPLEQQSVLRHRVVHARAGQDDPGQTTERREHHDRGHRAGATGAEQRVGEIGGDARRCGDLVQRHHVEVHGGHRHVRHGDDSVPMSSARGMVFAGSTVSSELYVTMCQPPYAKSPGDHRRAGNRAGDSPPSLWSRRSVRERDRRAQTQAPTMARTASILPPVNSVCSRLPCCTPT